jgi:hypothetical protein
VEAHTSNISEVIAGLRDIGYRDGLLEENYKFPDWFTPETEERQVTAAAFGQTPVSYDSACIGVVCANGLRGRALVNQCRALGAPTLLEIDKHEIREWAVSRTENGHGLVDRYSADRIGQMFASRASDWRPDSFLRAKNIGSFHWSQQLGLFSGLLPELEQHIQAQLDPLLRDALATTRSAYRSSTDREPDPTQLFKLIFWILAAKVFHDRRINRFEALGGDPDELLAAIAKQYRSEAVPILLNRQARQAAADRIWNKLDFRNLSVEVLSQMWSTTLVDHDTRKRLGIHRTSRTLVRYIVERVLPSAESGDDKKIILEPCSGSAVFLIGAMNFLRPKLFGMSPSERHNYFVRHLAAIENDPFGVEISRLALTLADFPNPGGWNIEQKDVFETGVLSADLGEAAVVLCNPPFEDFDEKERQRYQTVSPKKPAELLRRVLSGLHPRGILGFVLPVNFVDGKGYASVREQLAARFGTLDLTILPDRAFESDVEVALLIATDPIPHKRCRVINRKVNDDADSWKQFELEHKVSTNHASDFSSNEAKECLVIPELPEVWDYLINYPRLDDFATMGRGIEWNLPLTKKGIETGQRLKMVRREPSKGYRLGVPPQARFNAFEKPLMQYLNLRPEDQRVSAWRRPWDRPKAILNKSRRSRGPWRIAAFPDNDGATFYQTYIGVWPNSGRYDEFALSAILNSPVANAFVATREGRRDITVETLKNIPLPYFTQSQEERLRAMIRRYQKTIESHRAGILAASAQGLVSDDPETLLKQIDALVLDGYRMPPRLERRLLDFFRGHSRPTSHEFKEYIPTDCRVYFSLSEYLSADFKAATSGELLKRMAEN